MHFRRSLASGLFVALTLGTTYLLGRGLSQLLYSQILEQFPQPLPQPPSPPPALPAPSAAPAGEPPAPKPAAPSSTPLPAAAPAPAAPPPAAAAAPGLPRDLLGRVRVTPERVDGRVAGIRLWGVREQSVLALLGLKSGDRLEAINGYELGTPEHALRAYTELRNRDAFELRLVRDGRTIRHTYHVR